MLSDSSMQGNGRAAGLTSSPIGPKVIQEVSTKWKNYAATNTFFTV